MTVTVVYQTSSADEFAVLKAKFDAAGLPEGSISDRIDDAANLKITLTISNQSP